MNRLESLLSRRSYDRSKLTYPGPSENELHQLFDFVMTTPDHGNIKPWRIIVARGEESMEKLAALTLDIHKRQSKNGEISENSKRNAVFLAKLPMMIFIFTDVDASHSVSLWDQYLCAGAVTQNIMNGLHLQGYGAFWNTFLASDDIKPLLGMKPEDQIAGAIAVGTPTSRSIKNVKRKSPSPHCFEWQGLGVTPTKLFSD